MPGIQLFTPASSLQSPACQKTPVGVEPTSIGLQPIASPPGFSVASGWRPETIGLRRTASMSLSSSLKSPVSSLISVLARSRTWSTTFAESRAIRYTSRTSERKAECGKLKARMDCFRLSAFRFKLSARNCPTKDSNLALRFRRPPCVHHTRWACQAGGRRLEERFVIPASSSLQSPVSSLIKHEREDSNPMRQCWRLPALPGASLVAEA